MAFNYEIAQALHAAISGSFGLSPVNNRGNILPESHIASGSPSFANMLNFGDIAGATAGHAVTPTGFFRVIMTVGKTLDTVTIIPGATLDSGLRQVIRGLVVGVEPVQTATGQFRLIAHYEDGGTETIASGSAGTAVDYYLDPPALGGNPEDRYFWYSDPPPNDKPPRQTIPVQPTSAPVTLGPSGPDGPNPAPTGGPGGTPDDPGGGPGSGWPGDPNTLVGGTAWRAGWYVDSASGNYIVVSS